MNQKIIGADRGKVTALARYAVKETAIAARVTPWMTGNMELGPIYLTIAR
jgi:hypothetical protein